MCPGRLLIIKQVKGEVALKINLAECPIDMQSRSLSNLPRIFGSNMCLELQQHVDALATPASKVGILQEAALRLMKKTF